MASSCGTGTMAQVSRPWIGAEGGEHVAVCPCLACLPLQAKGRGGGRGRERMHKIFIN